MTLPGDPMSGRLEERGYDGLGSDAPPMLPDVGAEFGSGVQVFVPKAVGGRLLYAAVDKGPISTLALQITPALTTSPTSLRRRLST